MAAQLPYPKVGEEFELTLNFDDPDNDPTQMVYADAFFSSPEKCKFKRSRTHGTHTSRFKLVRVGHCYNIEVVQNKIGKYGKIPEGEWVQAFRAKFSETDGNGPVGVADPSWVVPGGGRVSFPCVDSTGLLYFFWSDADYDGDWRWLVEVPGARQVVSM